LSSTNKASILAPIRRRLLRGVGATALSPLVTAAIQLGTVPALLHSWGAAKYGDWLLLSAVPTYLSLSDGGFGDASGSDMTVRVAAGDHEGALETFQSSWAALSAASLLLGIFASSTVWFIPWQGWLNLFSISSGEAAEIILLLGTYVLLGQQSSILESGFRCDGNYALGTLVGTVIRLVEAVIPTLIGILTGRLLNVALAYLACRSVCTLGYSLLLRRKSPWLRFGLAHAKLRTVRRLFRPAFAFLAFPAGQVISLQGFTILIGASLGPLAVTTFTTLRTLTRMNFQVACTLARALWPELSFAFGSGDLRLARTLHRHGLRAALAVSAVSALVLWTIGPYVYLAWTRHSVAFNPTCFRILLLVSFSSSIWYISSVIPMSANLHASIAVNFLASTVVSLGIAAALLLHYGLAGAGISLLLIDAWMCASVLRTALNQTGDTFRELFRAVLFPISLAQSLARRPAATPRH
jgi:O-antigen/teichoic acid export membrane protein